MGVEERSRKKGPQIRVTQREAELIRLAAEDVTDKQIALKLGITRDTVATYWKRLKEKFHKQTRTGLVAYLLEGEVGHGDLDGSGIDWSELVLGITRSPDDPFELRTAAFERLNCGVVIEFPPGSIRYANQFVRRFWDPSRKEATIDEWLASELLESLRRKNLKTPLDVPVRQLQLPFYAGDIKGNLWMLWEQAPTLGTPSGLEHPYRQSLGPATGVVSGGLPAEQLPRPEVVRATMAMGQVYSQAVVETAATCSPEFKTICNHFVPILIGTSHEMVPFVLRGLLRCICEATSADVSLVYSEDAELGAWKPMAVWRRDALQRLAIEDELRQRRFRPVATAATRGGEDGEVVFEKHYDAVRGEWAIVCQLEYDGTYLGVWVLGGHSRTGMSEAVTACQINLVARCIGGAVFRTHLHS